MGDRTADDDTAPDAPTPGPRRWYDRGLVWLVVIVALVAGSLVTAEVVEDRISADRPPTDQARFCEIARGLRESTAVVVDLDAGVEPLLHLRDVTLSMERYVPGAVARDLRELADGLDDVVAAVEALSPDSPDAVVRVTAALEGQTERTDDAGRRVAAYVSRWCGFDPTAPVQEVPDQPEPGGG